MTIRFEVGNRYDGIKDNILVLDRSGSSLKIQMPNGHISEVEIKEKINGELCEYFTRAGLNYFACHKTREKLHEDRPIMPTKKSLMIKIRLIKATIAETTDKKELKRLQVLLEETGEEYRAVVYTYVD